MTLYFEIGDRVRVKDFDDRDWKFGVLTQVKPLKAIVDRGLCSFRWMFIEHLETPGNPDDVINILHSPETKKRRSSINEVKDDNDEQNDSSDHSTIKRREAKRFGFVKQKNAVESKPPFKKSPDYSKKREMNINIVDGVNNDVPKLTGFKEQNKQSEKKGWWSMKSILLVAFLTIFALGGMTIAIYNHQNISKDFVTKEDYTNELLGDEPSRDDSEAGSPPRRTDSNKFLTSSDYDEKFENVNSNANEKEKHKIATKFLDNDTNATNLVVTKEATKFVDNDTNEHVDQYNTNDTSIESSSDYDEKFEHVNSNATTNLVVTKEEHVDQYNTNDTSIESSSDYDEKFENVNSNANIKFVDNNITNEHVSNTNQKMNNIKSTNTVDSTKKRDDKKRNHEETTLDKCCNKVFEFLECVGIVLFLVLCVGFIGALIL
jgi:hypothetical protein